MVGVELTPAGGKRFEEATAANIGRRIAILVDGMVQTAPRVLSPITGGRLSISMGSGDGEGEAERVAKALRAR